MLLAQKDIIMYKCICLVYKYIKLTIGAQNLAQATLKDLWRSRWRVVLVTKQKAN